MNGFCKTCGDFKPVDIVTGICATCAEPDEPKTATMWIDNDGLHLEFDNED
jgi:hypothetical protein